MTTKEQFDLVVDQLYENAVQTFMKTPEYKLLKEKLERVDRDCETMLTQDEQEFAEEVSRH